MKVTDDSKLSETTLSAAIFIVNDIIDRVFTMTQDSKINVEPKSDVPNNDDVTERDVRLKSSTRPPRRNLTEDAVLDVSSDTDSSSVRCSLPLEKIDDHILQELSSSASNSDCNSVLSEVIVPPAISADSANVSPILKASSAGCKKRLFCLYCERIFVSSNLRQKHVERVHSTSQLRRSSSRTPGHSKLSPSCLFCGQDNIGNDLKKLLEHLVNEHSTKYHGCLDCEERFGSKESLKIHNSSVHGIEDAVEEVVVDDERDKELPQPSPVPEVLKETPFVENTTSGDMSLEKKNKKRVRKSDVDVVMEPLPPPPPNPMIEDFEETIIANVISAAELLKQKELMEKENALKLAELEKQKTVRNTKKGKARKNDNTTESPRTTRRSTKTSTPVKNKPKTSKTSPVPVVPNDENGADTKEQTKMEIVSKVEAVSIKVTPCEGSPPNYEFDENFFTCVSFNIQENLLNHLDGKLHTNNETLQSHSIVSKNSKTENNSYCSNSSDTNLALTALTPVTTLLTSQIGIDAYRQIEYGSKAPKQVTRKHYVKYNFRSRKQKPSDAENQKDISKLDMWTQVAMKMRQQKVKNSLNVTPTTSDEINRRNELQVEELNRILDTRGPFQDLHEEALNSTKNQEDDANDPNADNTDEIKTVLEDILINVFDKVPSTESTSYESNSVVNLDKFITDRLKSTEAKTATQSKVLKSELDAKSVDVECISYNRVTRSRYRNESTNEKLLENETLSYFNLTRTPSTSRKSTDMKSTTESLYKLGLDVKQMDKYLSEFDHEVIVSSSVELSGEWARPRIYICGACGLKIPSLKLLEDHKMFIHPHVWCVHYEFVGNQSEFYPHLNIPGLGRILENEKKEVVRNWEKSGARQCSKCQKECNTLGDLHRHMLECGGDWSWMLAKKKCKYRPFGARSRRRRVMELKRKLRVRLEGGNSTNGESSSTTTTRGGERRRNRSKLEGPRPPRPSDADTIQRMLANLPPKRATRKIICLKEVGLRKPNRLQNQNVTVGTNRSKFKTASQLLKSPTNNKNETIKAANQKMKQALQRNLRSRNQLMKNNEFKEATTPDRKVSPRTTRRSASNSPKNENKNQSTLENEAPPTVNNRKHKVQKVLASKIIDSNTSTGPKSKIFSRKKTRFGETVVTRLRNKILLAQKYINSDNTERMRLTRSRGLHLSKPVEHETKDTDSVQSKLKKSMKTVENKNEATEEPPKTKRRLRSLKFLTKTLRSQKKISEVSENIQNTPSTSPTRRSNRMRILSRIQRKLPSFSRRNTKDKETVVDETETPKDEAPPPGLPVPSIPEKPIEQPIENVENTAVANVENKVDENVSPPPVLEKIPTSKPKTNIDYCIESVVANITGTVTYKEYAQRSQMSDEAKKSSFSLKTFTQNMRNITKKISTNSKLTTEEFTNPLDVNGECSNEKVTLGKRKRVISTQTDNPSVLDDEQPPILFPQLPAPAPTMVALPTPVATIKDTISETIEDVIARYSIDFGDDVNTLSKSTKKLKTNGGPDNKCDTIPKNLSNQNFPMPILEAIGPPNELKRDSIVTIPILLPVVSHVIISTGTQINSNLLEKIMDTSINNFQLNNIVPADKNPLLHSPNGNTFNENVDSDKNGVLKAGQQASNKEYHNYVIETPMQKLIQNGLYPVLPNAIPNVTFDNIQMPPENSTNTFEQLIPEAPKVAKEKDKSKAKGLKKPIKKLNDCINMLKQKLMSSSSDNSDSNQRGEILKIPTPKFNKPPIFSDPVVKKITEAPFQTASIKKPVELNQCLDFTIRKQVDEVDQTSPIDLSCSASKLFMEPPIANEIEHIVETKSLQKPAKPKASINFSDLPRQMERDAEIERNNRRLQEAHISLMASDIHTPNPIILNVPEIESSIGNIDVQNNVEQNRIVHLENRTMGGTEQKEKSPDFTMENNLLNNNANLMKEKPKNCINYDANDNLSKTIEFVSKIPPPVQRSSAFDVQNLINSPEDLSSSKNIAEPIIINDPTEQISETVESTKSQRGRRRGTIRRIGTARTRNTRKFNPNDLNVGETIPSITEILPLVNNEVNREDGGSDTSFEDEPLIKLVQPKDNLICETLTENLNQFTTSINDNNVSKDGLFETAKQIVVVDNLTDIINRVANNTTDKSDNLTETINRVAENTSNKPVDNLTETINSVAENTLDPVNSKRKGRRKKVDPIITVEPEISKPTEIVLVKEIIPANLPVINTEVKIPEIHHDDQLSSLLRVRRKPGRKPKTLFDQLENTGDMSKSVSDSSVENTVITNMYHSTPEFKVVTAIEPFGNTSNIMDDTDLENQLTLFTVEKISPQAKISAQDPKISPEPLKSKPMPNPNSIPTSQIDVTNIIETKRPRLKPGRKPKKLFEPIPPENYPKVTPSSNESNISTTAVSLSDKQNTIESESKNITQTCLLKTTENPTKLDNPDALSEITEVKSNLNAVESQPLLAKRPGRKSKKLLEQFENKEKSSDIPLASTSVEDESNPTSTASILEVSAEKVSSDNLTKICSDSLMEIPPNSSDKSCEISTSLIEADPNTSIPPTIQEPLDKNSEELDTQKEVGENQNDSTEKPIEDQNIPTEDATENQIDSIKQPIENMVPAVENEIMEDLPKSKRRGRKSRKDTKKLEIENSDITTENTVEPVSESTSNVSSRNSTPSRKPGRKPKKPIENLENNIELMDNSSENLQTPLIENIPTPLEVSSLQEGKLDQTTVTEIQNEQKSVTETILTNEHELSQSSVDSSSSKLHKSRRKGRKSLERNKVVSWKLLNENDTSSNIELSSNLIENNVESSIEKSNEIEQIENKSDDKLDESLNENHGSSVTSEITQTPSADVSQTLKKSLRKSRKTKQLETKVEDDLKQGLDNVPTENEQSTHSEVTENPVEFSPTKKPERKLENLPKPSEMILDSSDTLISEKEHPETASEVAEASLDKSENSNKNEKDTRDDLNENLRRLKSVRKSKKLEPSITGSEISNIVESNIINPSDNLVDTNYIQTKFGRKVKKPEILQSANNVEVVSVQETKKEPLPNLNLKATRSKRKTRKTSSQVDSKSENSNTSNDISNNSSPEDVTAEQIQENISNTRLKSKPKTTEDSVENVDTINQDDVETSPIIESETVENIKRGKSGRKSKKPFEDVRDKSQNTVHSSYSKSTVISDSEDELPLAILSKQAEKVLAPIIENKVETVIPQNLTEKIEKSVENNVPNKSKEIVDCTTQAAEMIRSTEFQFKEPEIRLTPIKAKILHMLTPGDETTDDEGDVPLAQRFGISKLPNLKLATPEINSNVIIEDKNEIPDEDKNEEINPSSEDNVSEKDSKSDSDSKKRRGRPKKKEGVVDIEDFQPPRRITRRSNSLYVPPENLDEANKDVIQDPMETETLGNILMENNQNIENLDQIESKKIEKKSDKLTKIDEKVTINSQENAFSPPDEVDSIAVNHNEENALKHDFDRGTIASHKLKKQRKISMPPPPAPKKCEENLEKITITFKKVSKLNSTIGLQLTDFENVQIITKPKTDTVVQPEQKLCLPPSPPAVTYNRAEETDEESNIPLAQRTFLQKPRLSVNVEDKNVFQFKQPGLPFSRCKRRNTLPAVFNGVDETTDEEADVPLAQRFGIRKPPVHITLPSPNPAEETEDEDRIMPLAERLEMLRKKSELPFTKTITPGEETEDEDRIIPLAERLAKLKQIQANKAMHIKVDPKVPDPAEETDEECYLPLAERIAKLNKKVIPNEPLNIKINTKIPDPAEETDEECYLPLAERIAMRSKIPEIVKPVAIIAAIPNPADETEDEDRILPLAQRIAMKRDTFDTFKFKEPEIPESTFYQRRRKISPAIFTPADETTDEEGDVPLARRFGLPKPPVDEDHLKKRKIEVEESTTSKSTTEIPEFTRKRRKSITPIIEISAEETTDKLGKSVDVFDFTEPDSPVGFGLDNIRHKAKSQSDVILETPEIEEFSNVFSTDGKIIERHPKKIKITSKFHSEKQKKAPVKKVFKIRKKRRKLKFTNRRYKKVISKVIIEEPEIIVPPPEVLDEQADKNDNLETVEYELPTIGSTEKVDEIVEELPENMDDDESRHSSNADAFDNHTDVSSLSDTAAENISETTEAVILERHSPLLLRIKTNFKAKGKRGRPPVKKVSISVDNTENYCEICNKHFCRADNLIKHKMTFTHIAKLSELEAKEIANRRLQETNEETPTTSGEKDNALNPVEPQVDDKLNETDEDDDDVFEESSNFGNDVASRDLDELALKFIVRKNRLMDDDSIGNSDEASTDAFNLGNGVNYPDLVTSHQPKRYRSLGERKSFDSNQSILSPERQLDELPQNSPIPDSIIQDEDSNDMPFEIPPADQQRPKSQNANDIFDYLKKSDSKGPSTPTFEFHQHQFEENFTRKKLNRDEELFLECCSLLKNNPKSRKISKLQFDDRTNDVQSSSRVIENSVEAARIDEWSNSNSVASDWLSQKESTSNPPFGQSTLMNNLSYKFSSDGNAKNKPQNFEEIPFKSIAVNEYMDFSNIHVGENHHPESKKINSRDKDDFAEINSLLSSDTSGSSINDDNSLNSSLHDEDSLNNPDLSDFCGSKQDDSTVDSKKIPTKGALKIFEGIKVSIPTQEINLAEVLSSTQNKILQIESQLNNSIDTGDDDSNDTNNKKSSEQSLKLYKNGVEVSQSILKSSKNKLITSFLEKKSGSEKSFSFSDKDEIVKSPASTKRLANKCGNKLGLKESKKKFPKSEKKSQTPTMKAKAISKAKDIYDFEDSQDEFGGDQLNFKTYRDQKLFSPNDTKDETPTENVVENNENTNNSDSEDDHHDYIDSFSVDESSHSSEEDEPNQVFTKVDPQPAKKNVTASKPPKNENKKGMIMGRIFKHVVKPKTSEDGALSPKDANTLFDSLLGKTLEEKSNQEVPKETVEMIEQPAPPVKTVKPVAKSGKKPGKRTKPADSSSDDDFCLARKPQKKVNRRKKGNANNKDDSESASGINLEQEIRECIGVAGRKSQRKCTSGKQNILVEFWSSDELSDSEKRMKENINEENNLIADESNKDNLSVNKENDIGNENIELNDNVKSNNEIKVHTSTTENNPLNETTVNINEIKTPGIQRKIVRKGGTARRKPRVQMNKISRKCSKIRSKTKARGRQRKKILPNNNNLDVQPNSQNITPKETNSLAVTRRKRSASEKLYYWSSSSDDEFEDFIEVKPIREDPDDDRPMHHGWIVGDSPKKLVTMLAQAKGKKVDAVYVKEQGKRNRVTL